jgi:multiple sugar transport system permease protein/fructooligosaccharide transport system permease protein
MAALTLASLPMLLIYIFMQKYYVEGIAGTGIKG